MSQPVGGAGHQWPPGENFAVVNTQTGDLSRVSMAAYIRCLGRKSVWRDYFEPRHVRSMGPYTGAEERGEREKGEGRSRWHHTYPRRCRPIRCRLPTRGTSSTCSGVAASESCTLTMRMKHGFSASRKAHASIVVSTYCSRSQISLLCAERVEGGPLGDRELGGDILRSVDNGGSWIGVTLAAWGNSST